MPIKTVDTLIVLQVSDTKKSRNPNEKYKTIKFYDPKGDAEYQTHVVSKFGNFKNWLSVINRDYVNDTIILTGNFSLKDLDLINADSKFSIAESCSWNDVADIVESVRR
jgi:hypothetical protein